MHALIVLQPTPTQRLAGCLRGAGGNDREMSMHPATHPPVLPVQELRLAVVLYGGVSLAIYIHGVTLELQRLVRATAPQQRPGPSSVPLALLSQQALRGSEKIYRRLGQLLGSRADWRTLDIDAPICTRFVIDILAGTSAGGINAVYLAKALANDQDLGDLTRLWLAKGDLERLLNRAPAPASLLDGDLLYRDLLAAFDAMDSAQPTSPDESPYVDELDLYVTATDVRGRVEPLPLVAGVQERRHRQVFHFQYAAAHAAGDASNDFRHHANPLLAFAARCTSSFPVAFAPFRFADGAASRRGREPDEARLRRLFRCWGDGDLALEHQRAFADGGELDNKPFSHATAALARRRAELPVLRQLIYVEPVPEHPEDATADSTLPDAIENASAALLDLPRHETIREDLAAVVERNRLINRVQNLLRGIEKDVDHRPTPLAQPRSKAAPETTASAWRNQDLRDQIDAYGAPYGAYHRLKVQGLLDELAGTAARLTGFADDGAERDGLRRLLARWMTAGYAEFRHDLPSGGATENQLLLFYDLPYRFRRLEFLARTANDLHRLDHRDRQWREALEAAGAELPDSEALGTFRDAVRVVRWDLAEVTRDLRQERRRLRDPARSPLAIHLAPCLAHAGELADLARNPSAQAACETRLWQALAPAINGFTAALDQQLKPAFERASRRCRELLDPEHHADWPRWTRAVRTCLWHYYRYFDHYDLILFPLTFGTPVGEATAVELVRISPEDAPTLIDERHDARGRRKLAGTSLGNFGAFLSEAWRRNDLLWGRLDAAERLIRAALPEQDDAATAWIAEAHDAIIAEELTPAAADALTGLLAQSLIRLGRSQVPASDELLRLIEQDCGRPVGVRLVAILRHCLSQPALREHLARGYEVDRRIDPAHAARLASRTALTAGRLLTALADRHRGSQRLGPWLTRLGAFSWGFIELALPGSGWNLLARHWLHLLYLVELLLVVGGLLAGASAAQDLGARALVATAAAHLLLAAFGTWLTGGIRGRRAWLRAGVWMVAALVVLTAILALSGVAVTVIEWWRRLVTRS